MTTITSVYSQLFQCAFSHTEALGPVSVFSMWCDLWVYLQLVYRFGEMAEK